MQGSRRNGTRSSACSTTQMADWDQKVSGGPSTYMAVPLAQEPRMATVAEKLNSFLMAFNSLPLAVLPLVQS